MLCQHTSQALLMAAIIGIQTSGLAGTPSSRTRVVHEETRYAYDLAWRWDGSLDELPIHHTPQQKSKEESWLVFLPYAVVHGEREVEGATLPTFVSRTSVIRVVQQRLVELYPGVPLPNVYGSLRDTSYAADVAPMAIDTLTGGLTRQTELAGETGLGHRGLKGVVTSATGGVVCIGTREGTWLREPGGEGLTRIGDGRIGAIMVSPSGLFVAGIRCTSPPETDFIRADFETCRWSWLQGEWVIDTLERDQRYKGRPMGVVGIKDDGTVVTKYQSDGTIVIGFWPTMSRSSVSRLVLPVNRYVSIHPAGSFVCVGARTSQGAEYSYRISVIGLTGAGTPEECQAKGPALSGDTPPRVVFPSNAPDVAYISMGSVRRIVVDEHGLEYETRVIDGVGLGELSVHGVGGRDHIVVTVHPSLEQPITSASYFVARER